MNEMKSCLISILLFYLFSSILVLSQVQEGSQNWRQLISTNGIRFSARNGHAACVFKNKLWVVGGRAASYTDYNLQQNDKMADVWSSVDGAMWVQEEQLDGDFYAQNIDVVQPGSKAPWYNRFGHSLNAIDITNDGIEDIMILCGGFSPSPDNDCWVTENGRIWMFAGHAPWSPRAWHATTVFQGQLWLMGGTPLNNEVWRLNSARKYMRRAPLTRSHYTNSTYELTWEHISNASWSPRVGMGLVSQWYFNTTAGETVRDSAERMVLLGGYGGWLDGVNPELYDGFSCRNDVWETYDGRNWTLLGYPSNVDERAWVGMVTQIGYDVRFDRYMNTTPPKIYLFGGGYVGFKSGSQKRVNTVIGRADALWSWDGLHWTQINYEEGGGNTGFTFYSSQEWAETIVDTVTKYLGLWGHTVNQFVPQNLVVNFSDGSVKDGDLFLVGGLYAGGDYSNNVWQSQSGIFCDTNGITCNGNGNCNATGCFCKRNYGGNNCDTLMVRGRQSSSSVNYVYYVWFILVSVSVACYSTILF